MFRDGEDLIYSYLETFEVVKIQKEFKIPFSLASYNHTLNTKNLTEFETKKLLPHAWKAIIWSPNLDFKHFSTQTYSQLTTLNLSSTNVRDLEPLKDMPITTLDLCCTKVSDLTPLKGMQITNLDLSDTKVSDLEPLKGMPLTTLNLSYTKVSNLESLKGMPLTNLYLSNTMVSNLESLKGMPLTTLDLSYTKVSNLESLKDMPLTDYWIWGLQRFLILSSWKDATYNLGLHRDKGCFTGGFINVSTEEVFLVYKKFGL